MTPELRDFYRARRVLITGGMGFIGSNLARLLAEAGADILVVDSLNPEYGGNRFNLDGLPNIVLEALSAGAAVVATTAGGIGTVVDHERTGLVVPERRPDAIADAVQRLASSPALRSSLGEAARHMVETRFGWGHTAERFEAAYRRAVANKAGGR